MRSALIFSAVALSAANAPPRIELDLSAMTSAYKLDASIYRTHDQGKVQPINAAGSAYSGVAVKSRQDWTERCPAKTTPAACPFPSAKAYDHQDSEVVVTTRVFLVDNDSTPINTQVTNVDFDKRSTYLFKYDANDAAGNHAEQVVFALILDDLTAPVISVCSGTAETVEAASAWTLCSGSIATDNIDVTVPISYTVTQVATGVKLCTKATQGVAMAAITTNTVGEFLVELYAEDQAGIYGTDAKNNFATASKSVLVKDTRAPYIDMHGSVGGQHECSITYTDASATATDLLDTEALGQTITVTADNQVDAATVGHYTVTYNAHDYAGNAATEQTRPVEVVDTTVPVVTLNGPQGSTVTHYAGETFSDDGATCADTCDMALPAIDLTWSRTWNDKQLGDYIRTYTCTDASSNVGTTTRKFTIVDNAVPMLHLVGDDALTFEASVVEEYTDDGATCEDYVDGALSHAVEVSGQVVNMRVPGTYVIRYDCQDLSGNQAQHLTRSVVVKDTTCPELTRQGLATIYVEAGFPYVDSGATATDSLDGTITNKVWTDGDTVDTSNAFYSMRSCQGIKTSFSGAADGIYYITSYVEATQQYERQLVWCDMDAQNGYTYLAVVCGTRIVPSYSTASSTDQGDCPKYGLAVASFADQAIKDRAIAKFHDASMPDHSRYFPDSGASTDYYLCSTNDGGAATHLSHNEGNMNGNNNIIDSTKITRAEAGKYVIFYHVSDNAGNKECDTESRTVIVKDTLPPVITLHLDSSASTNAGDLIHTGDKLAATNTAADAATNPYLSSSYSPAAGVVSNTFSLMAEQPTVSTDAWVVGAVASAVTGLALIAYGSK
jgi:hypothetical protein